MLASRRLAATAPGLALLPGVRCPVRRAPRPPAPGRAPRVFVAAAASRPDPPPLPAPATRAPTFRPSPDPLASSRPLVLLCGWLNCRPRDLDKYATAWRELGHDTLATCPGLGPLLWPPLADRAAERLETAALAALAGRPNAAVIAHVFSNGGFYAAGAVLGREREREREERENKGEGSRSPSPSSLNLSARLAGLAFDSCPARLDPDLAARGVTAALLGEAAGTKGRRGALVGAMRPALGALLASPSSPLGRRVEGAWGAWAALAAGLPPGLPRLFLYSEADALIPAAEVEGWAGRVMGGGGGGGGGGGAPSPAAAAAVTMRRFPGSPHCEHLRSDPAGYRAALAGLAREVEGFSGRERGEPAAAA